MIVEGRVSGSMAAEKFRSAFAGPDPQSEVAALSLRQAPSEHNAELQTGVQITRACCGLAPTLGLMALAESVLPCDHPCTCSPQIRPLLW